VVSTTRSATNPGSGPPGSPGASLTHEPPRPEPVPASGWLLALAGVVAAVCGIALSEAAAWALRTEVSPVTAVAARVRDLTPGPVVELSLQLFGSAGKSVLLGGTVAVVLLACGWAAGRARRSPLLPDVVFVALGGLGLVAVLAGRTPTSAQALAVLVGTVAWIVIFRILSGPLLDDRSTAVGAGAGVDRRRFLTRLGLVVGVTAALTLAGRVAGGARRGVEASRRLLRLPVSTGEVPTGADLGLEDLAPWRTPAEDFYLIHTALAAPSIRPDEWQLRIHGLVDRELVLGYADLLERGLEEAWVTLCCVSNEVGGDLIGNAWWSGVRVRDLLRDAGVQPGADAVLQTSMDGWTCGTPLAALTDERDALLAVAMNGRPLPVEHGFPVRMVVPGLYGYVSATKWVVDLEVTRFDRISAYWTERGWGELGPVKTQSRVDVPRNGADVPAGEVVIAGVAWAQHTGIERVEVQLDGGAWQQATRASVPSVDTWVQWSLTTEVEPGDHEVVVRATDRSGQTQTAARSDVLPDGATGWHSSRFTAE
jgi:DMSO/TMAO reductase YedYZ molybdopterin-dependent catalytic subunit